MPINLAEAASADLNPGRGGTGRVAGVGNFPGPRYGLPGYKASHNWEGQNDVDLLSPLIFDWKAYLLKYDKQIQDKSESGAKKDWLAKLKALKYPNCRQGRYHSHPPGGFSLKLYYDAHKAGMRLGAAPSCQSIAQSFLSQGIFQGKAWASTVSGEQKPLADGKEVAGGKVVPVPPSSWLLCKWRRGAAKQRKINMWDSLSSAYKLQQVYSRNIAAYDMVMSKLDGAMYGFKPSLDYTVTFWYRPQKRFIGQVFNFGESVDFKYGRRNSRKYWSPGCVQDGYNDQGVTLSFQVTTSMKHRYECAANKDGKGNVLDVIDAAVLNDFIKVGVRVLRASRRWRGGRTPSVDVPMRRRRDSSLPRRTSRRRRSSSRTSGRSTRPGRRGRDSSSESEIIAVTTSPRAAVRRDTCCVTASVLQYASLKFFLIIGGDRARARMRRTPRRPDAHGAEFLGVRGSRTLQNVCKCYV